MAKKVKPDYIANQIKKLLLPVAEKDGFRLFKPKQLVRVKQPFVDVIGFQISQYGTKLFYVHYYRELLANPMMKLGSYSMGYRLSNNQENSDSRKWVGLEDLQAQEALLSVVDAYKSTISNWYKSTESIDGYVFEYLVKNRVKTINSLNMAIAFYEAGKTDRSYWICNDIVDEYEAEPKNKDAYPEHLKYVKKYLESSEAESIQALIESEEANRLASKSGLSIPSAPNVEYKTVDHLVNSWREMNINKYKLENFVVH